MKVFTLATHHKGEWPHGGTTVLAPAFRKIADAQAAAEHHCDVLYYDWYQTWLNDWRLWVSKYPYEPGMDDYETGDAFYIDINSHELK